MKYRKGDWVKFSGLAFKNNITDIQKFGIVMHNPRKNSDVISVLWNGRTSESRYHKSFLQKRY